tara:strand:- start:1069 stop:1209 length:141 start_codon:yes stop_codon:yes gene_type:complete
MVTAKDVFVSRFNAGFETTFAPPISFEEKSIGQKKACEMQQPDMVP